MIHIYCGDGKGKTTCAFGLALRAAGRGNRVIIAQFLKGADSGERLSIAKVPGVTLLEVPEEVKFSFMMNDEEKARASSRFERELDEAARAARASWWCWTSAVPPCPRACCPSRWSPTFWTAAPGSWRWS